MAFTHDSMRERFHEAGREKEAILARSTPVRSREAALRAQIAELEASLRQLVAERKAIEAPIAGLDNERGVLARALGGQTGAA